MRLFNPYKMYVGSFIPEWLMQRTEISAGAKLCYARLMRFAGKDGYCYPKRDKIAQAIGVSERQVDRYINELKSMDLIYVKQNGFGKSNTYHFIKNDWLIDSMNVANQDLTDASSQESPYMSSHESSNVSSPNRRESYEKSHVKIDNHAFAQFWELYDKKVDRKRAYQRWSKLRKSDIDLIMEFIPIYKKSVSDKQYMKNPDTFLNSRIWEDDWNEYKPKNDERSTAKYNGDVGRTQYAYDRYKELFGE